jgi:hypothetical protein
MVGMKSKGDIPTKGKLNHVHDQVTRLGAIKRMDKPELFLVSTS